MAMPTDPFGLTARAYEARAAAGGGLIGRDGYPVNEIMGKETAQRHQHQLTGTKLPPTKVHAIVQAVGTYVPLTGSRIIMASSFMRSGSRINPVTLPSASRSFG